jgi:CheY-like chemotaxis protein
VTKPGQDRSRRALVIDDSEPVRALVARVLSSAGYQVDAVASVVAALTFAEAHSYDVAVVDVNLAGSESGSDVVAGLRARDDDLANRCLLLTGGATDDLPEGVAVLVKPFLAEELVEAARRLHPDQVTSDPPNPGAPNPGAPNPGAPNPGAL